MMLKRVVLGSMVIMGVILFLFSRDLVGQERLTTAQITNQVKKLMNQGRKLLLDPARASQRRGALLFWKVYRLIPHHLEGLDAGAWGCSILARLARSKKQIAFWGKRGWKIAKKLIQLFPKRAEGYYWASISIGHYARGAGIWTAMTQGLAGKIKKMALKSIQLNPTLKKGAAQLVLGRFYFKLPWPMRNLKKSIYYLKQAHTQRPNHPATLHFLAEAYWANGQRSKARHFYRLCAAKNDERYPPNSAPRRCQKWLKNH